MALALLYSPPRKIKEEHGTLYEVVRSRLNASPAPFRNGHFLPPVPVFVQGVDVIITASLETVAGLPSYFANNDCLHFHSARDVTCGIDILPNESLSSRRYR